MVGYYYRLYEAKLAHLEGGVFEEMVITCQNECSFPLTRLMGDRCELIKLRVHRCPPYAKRFEGNPICSVAVEAPLSKCNT
jgi:hypothetical protein